MFHEQTNHSCCFVIKFLNPERDWGSPLKDIVSCIFGCLEVNTHGAVLHIYSSKVDKKWQGGNGRWCLRWWNCMLNAPWRQQVLDTASAGFKNQSGASQEGYPLDPSGKHHHNYGTSPCLKGKLTINGHVHPFSIAMLNYQRLWISVLIHQGCPCHSTRLMMI